MTSKRLVCHTCRKMFWAKNKKQMDRAAAGLPVFHNRACAAIYGGQLRMLNPDAYTIIRQQARSFVCPWEAGKIKGSVWQRQVAIW